MAGAVKLTKKKYSQQELRRIMSETKAAKQPSSLPSAKKIDSPLAKYNDLGQLTCVLCRTVVRSEAVWKVHVNSKQHKENVELTKQCKAPAVRQATSTSSTALPTKDADLQLKRPAAPAAVEEGVPKKKPKGILKNGSQMGSDRNGSLPSDFFDNSSEIVGETTSSIRRDLVNIRLPEKHREQQDESIKQEQAGLDIATAAPCDEEKLPEGFFDDPKMDAKARNQEYKDPNDEEWDKFQKEIKEATNISMAIISEEQEESTAERQISEIDEQIRNWSRVLSLEKKKEQVQTMKGSAASLRCHTTNNGTPAEPSNTEADEDEVDDDDEFDEFLDWRAKKSYK